MTTTLRMMIGLIFLAITCGFVNARDRQDLALHAISDPGTEPPIYLRDYDAFRHGGTATIAGRVSLNEPPYHNFICSAPVLYPDTAFLRWLIEKWASELDGRPMLKSRLVYPGDSGMNLQIPDFINLMKYSSDGALIEGHCADYHDFTEISFTNVPAGKYIMIETLQRGVAYVSHSSKALTVYGPFGAAPGYLDSTHGGVHPADGFVIATPRELDVIAGHSYTLAPDITTPIAYFLDS